MLFSIEPLFFSRSDELPVFDDTGGGITVIRVDPQNVQADNSSRAHGDWIYFEMANLLPSWLRRRFRGEF